MKSNILKTGLVTLMLATMGLTGSWASAGILLEPYIGYGAGKYKFSTTEQDTSGLFFGGRVGYKKLGFMAGLDYLTGNMTDDANPKNDVTPKDMGVFVGFEFPILLRALVTYNFSSKLDLENSEEYEGNGLKFLVGFTALPLVSINLEYVLGKYDEGSTSGALATDLETTFYGLSVSLPFDLM